MFEFIKENYKKGDKLRLTCVKGEFSGEIIYIGGDSIILKTLEGKTCGIKGSEISYFEELTTALPNPDLNEDKSIEDCLTRDYKEETALKTNKPIQEPTDKEHCQIGNQGDVNHGESQEEKQKINDITTYKPGDVIPLSELYKIDPSLKKKKSESTKKIEISKGEIISGSTNALKKEPKKKLSTLGNSFVALAPLVEEQHEIDNLKSVPAIGAITNLREDRNFGFIHDSKTGHHLYFSFNDVVGDLQIVLHKGVLFTEITNAEGYKAICVHKSGTVKDLLALSEDVAQKGKIPTALNIVEHILGVYPDNYSANMLRDRFSKQLKTLKHYSLYTSDGNPYSKAKECYLKKDFEKAIEYYLQAIKERDRVESAVKDLAVMYVQLYKSDYKSKAESWREIAIKLIDDNIGLLSRNLTNQNFLLHNFYLPLGEYEKAIKIIEIIIDNIEIQNDNNKCSALLYTKAFALLRLKKIEGAEEAIDEALSYNSKNSSALQLKELIKNIDITDNEQLESFVSATEFNIISGGLSAFILQTLEKYDEYAGAKTKDIESRHFTQSTLKDVREVISKAGTAR